MRNHLVCALVLAGCGGEPDAGDISWASAELASVPLAIWSVPATTPSQPTRDTTPEIWLDLDGGQEWVDVFRDCECLGVGIPVLAPGDTTVFVDTTPITELHAQADGVTCYSARTRDKFGAVSACTPWPFLQYHTDNTPPATPSFVGSTPPPSPPSAVLTPTLQLAGLAPGVVLTVYRGPGCTGASLMSPSPTVTAVAPISAYPSGITVYTARARDAAGNLSACSAPFSYQADILPPDTLITTFWHSPWSAHAEFIATEPGSFQCSMDGGPWAPCTSPKVYSGLSWSPHVFRVRAIDLAGNLDPVPAQRSF